MTPTQNTFANGAHLRAARTLAGLKQTELAALAGLHVNSLKRLENKAYIGRGWAIEKIGNALAERGIIAQRYPLPFVQSKAQ